MSASVKKSDSFEAAPRSVTIFILFLPTPKQKNSTIACREDTSCRHLFRRIMSAFVEKSDSFEAAPRPVTIFILFFASLNRSRVVSRSRQKRARVRCRARPFLTRASAQRATGSFFFFQIRFREKFLKLRRKARAPPVLLLISLDFFSFLLFLESLDLSFFLFFF